MPVVSNGWYRSRPELERPDIQTLIVANSPFAGPWFPGIKKPAPHMFASRSGLQHPESRGWMTLASADPFAPPRIFFNLFSARRRSRGVALCDPQGTRNIRGAAVKHFMGREIIPGPDLVTDAQLDAFIRNTTTTAYHPVGTCKMGTDAQAVVDPKLRVRGIERLARRRRLHHAHHHGRQHQRALRDDRRQGGRDDLGPGIAPRGIEPRAAGGGMKRWL